MAVRQRRGFKFHEKGKFEQLAQRLRAKVRSLVFTHGEKFDIQYVEGGDFVGSWGTLLSH